MSAQCILLVDDQRDIVRLLHSALQTLGHELDIIDAPSGEEALLEASRRKIDLLVADYRLPGISGVEMMRKIRARNAELLVGDTSSQARRHARRAIGRGRFARLVHMSPRIMAGWLTATPTSPRARVAACSICLRSWLKSSAAWAVTAMASRAASAMRIRILMGRL